MAGFKIYDSKEVSIIFSALPISASGGYADGEFCKIERQTETFLTVEGTDGEVTRSKSNSKLIKVTISLMQSSSGNILLSAIHTLDESAGNGAGVAPILIRDAQGTSTYFAGKAWISKAPDVMFDKTATARVWELMAVEDARVDGGN